MPDYDKLLQARLPEALETAIESIDRAFDQAEQLLHADVGLFEQLDLCVFAYFGRDDVFYLNTKGRQLLKLRLPSLDRQNQGTPPIFWLEDEERLAEADAFVAQRGRPIFGTRELVTLAWGKSWFEGAKFPIRSIKGDTIAILFAGHELAPSKQIQQVAEHYQTSQNQSGEN